MYPVKVKVEKIQIEICLLTAESCTNFFQFGIKIKLVL